MRVGEEKATLCVAIVLFNLSKSAKYTKVVPYGQKMARRHESGRLCVIPSPADCTEGSTDRNPSSIVLWIGIFPKVGKIIEIRKICVFATFTASTHRKVCEELSMTSLLSTLIYVTTVPCLLSVPLVILGD